MPLVNPVTVEEPPPETADDVEVPQGKITVTVPVKDSVSGRVFHTTVSATIDLERDSLPAQKVTEAEQLIKDVLSFKGVWTP